ncbi:holo-ACP synthase [Buchnera aphidicola]|uniref:Holo-[acyl-carrier-protein] synthase n=1 Tax=Buchnera aphidicola subsp. Melaphis rhois TaxID=118103 RepID=A0A4D6Y198_BUCMH|nr:holo-ACP synthase [Buchnera aphidicola]QCI23266.1 holo-ACP synthase [Buchnera aphidicola (Melaphis rhois)]
MSIIGIGIDVVSIKRIKSVISKLGNKFACRILSEFELHEYKKNAYPILFLAKRFSSKEAASKALGIGIKNGITFNDFELYHDNLGKPYLRLLKKAQEMSKILNINSIHISITDEKLYVSTLVIFENK